MPVLRSHSQESIHDAQDHSPGCQYMIEKDFPESLGVIPIAVERRPFVLGLSHNTDQGRQDTTSVYRQRCHKDSPAQVPYTARDPQPTIPHIPAPRTSSLPFSAPDLAQTLSFPPYPCLPFPLHLKLIHYTATNT